MTNKQTGSSPDQVGRLIGRDRWRIPILSRHQFKQGLFEVPPRRSLRILITFTLVASLSGCFELSQTLVIRDDETASFQIDMGFDQNLINLATMENGGESVSFCESDQALEVDIPEGLNVIVNQRLEGDFLFCSYSFSGSLKKFVKFSASMTREGNDANLFKIELLGNKKLRLTSIFDFSGDKPEDSDTDLATELLAKQMIVSAFEGRTFRWLITAPEILSSNGIISEDRKMVTWELPISVAVLSEGTYIFQAVVVYGKPWYKFLEDFKKYLTGITLPTAVVSLLMMILVFWLVSTHRKSREISLAWAQSAGANRRVVAAHRRSGRMPDPAPFDCVLAGEDEIGSSLVLNLRWETLGNPDGVVIGRNPPGSGHVVADQSISREHARVLIKDGTPFVEDLNSTNGTSLNGRPLSPDVLERIGDGDELTFGSVTFRVYLKE